MTAIAPDLVGVQEPRILIAPEFRHSDYEAAVALGRDFGIYLDEFQQIILKHLFSETDEGAPAVTTIGISVPRQNGKNEALVVFELYVLLVYKQNVLHTAHEVPTAKAHQDRMIAIFENTPELQGRAKTKVANGQLSIKVTDGGELRFSARSKNAARGFTGVAWLVIDEAQSYNDDDQAALRPVISASGADAVQVLTGTPPYGANDGQVFKRIRAAALEGDTNTRRAWLEWSADPEADLDDPAAWAQANPALGRRIALTTVEDERSDMDDGSFARERLGMWSTAKSTAVIDPRTWDLRTDTHSLTHGALTLAVDAAPDLSTATISVAAQRQDGRWHCESIEQRAGIDWLPEVLLAIYNKPENTVTAVVMDERNAAKKFVPDLEKAGVPLILTNMAMMGAACEGFYNAVMDNTLRHTGQPALNTSLSLARKRKIMLGTMWAWQKSTPTADLTPLVSVTLALYGARANHIAPTQKKKRGKNWSR